MTYRVKLSAQAEQDLGRVYRYIEAETSLRAADWFNGLYDALESLSEIPQRSPMIREDPSLHHLLYGTRPHIYRVIYLIDEERASVVVLSIRHGARRGFEPQDL
jgi:plasmid stabilization system protein ParE